MKKLFAIVMALLLLAGYSGTAYADDTVYSEGYFYYTVEDGSITIVGYFGNETEVTIPASIAGMPVNAVAPGAFAGTSVTKLYLPDTVMDYQDSEGGRIDVVFDANTDHPYSVSTDDIEPGGELSGDEEATVDAEVDLNAVEERDNLLQSVSPVPAPTEEPEEGAAGTAADDPAEESAEGTDGEKSEEDPAAPQNGTTVAIVAAAAAAACAAAVVIFRKKKTEKEKED